MDVYVREEFGVGPSLSVGRLTSRRSQKKRRGGDIEIVENRAVVQQRMPAPPLCAA
jgi:hypothetical protein